MNQPPQPYEPEPQNFASVTGAEAPYRVPHWRLPPGVSPGTYEYTRRESIARDYSEFLANTPLVTIDLQIVLRELLMLPTSDQPVIDLGCGDGRALRSLVAAGFNVIGVDMSQPMLTQVRIESEKAQQDPPPLLRANLVQLQCLTDACAAHAVCLFSTIGMIQKRVHRQEFMRHVARVVAPEGRFIVHVHNRNDAWRDRASREAYFASWRRSWIKRDVELGDRVYSYRGLADMFLHTYSLPELKRDLTMTGWRLQSLYPLNAHSDALLSYAAWLPSLRAGGFIAIAKHSTH